jgi:hypothetical protein
MPTEKRLEWEQLLAAGAKPREALPNHLLGLLDTLDEKLGRAKAERSLSRTLDINEHSGDVGGRGADVGQRTFHGVENE